MQSASVSSRGSSRKRSRELYWKDVLEGSDITIPDTIYTTPEHFTEMTERQKKSFMEEHLHLRSDQVLTLTAKVNEALQSKPIPSPSGMK